MIVINVLRDFSEEPSGRCLSDGPDCAVRLRNIIIGHFEQKEIVQLELDGVLGYSFAFLEECFGGLVRQGYSIEYLKAHLHIVTDNHRYKHNINLFMEAATTGNYGLHKPI